MKETILKIKGKVVGKIVGDEYITTRNKTKHFMFMFKGYGISENILSFLKEKKIKTIKISDEYKTYSFKLNEYTDSRKIYKNEEDIQKFVTIDDTHANLELNKFIKKQEK